ncbi:hypothetical protein SARC_04329 [Sphaeroforma arctica JP610]|uniref:Pseudouridine synthase RsuA/RluA-like domain-containing protein n=1 Tax=Sphaeroforma arctica JP610 TaxID=667725 RepID=A0A0L0G2P9_9EUKA|nr:hypothetical protein SARC_04329 [Sphaeroforma arctica JP610]KNC83412.1 hypothetical protein SARC_04329 [Sphaeroforma arctica JP610]|eukprot:XP_014157314.1 hypothetical protein SARC_04329 [Sphaeroforma arctica JP610]
MPKKIRVGPNADRSLNFGTSKIQAPATDLTRLSFDAEQLDIDAHVDKVDGYRLVRPYYYVYRAFCKGRWTDQTVIDTLIEEFKAGTEEYYRTAIKEGRIGINERRTEAEYRMKQGDRLVHWIHRHEPPVTDQPIDIVHEDDEVIVVNKPASIPVHPCGRYRVNSVAYLMGLESGYPDLGVVHRLDRLTSGILILGKTTKVAAKYSEWIRDRDVQKTYLARVRGVFPSEPCACDLSTGMMLKRMGVVGCTPDGKPALTNFELLHTDGKTSVVKCMPRTGRQHQIRVHLQYLGHPIVNDPIYAHPAFGDAKGEELKDPALLERVDAALLAGVLRNDAPHEIFPHQGIQPKTPQLGQVLPEDKTATAFIKSTALKFSVNAEEPSEFGSTLASTTDGAPLTTVGQVVDLEGVSAAVGAAYTAEDVKADADKEPSAKRTHSPTRPDNVGSQKKYKKSYEIMTTPLAADIDPYCGECRIVRPRPSPSTMVLYLHAYKYEGDAFNYTAPAPAWASEGYTTDEESSTTGAADNGIDRGPRPGDASSYAADGESKSNTGEDNKHLDVESAAVNLEPKQETNGL